MKIFGYAIIFYGILFSHVFKFYPYESVINIITYLVKVPCANRDISGLLHSQARHHYCADTLCLPRVTIHIRFFAVIQWSAAIPPYTKLKDFSPRRLSRAVLNQEKVRLADRSTSGSSGGPKL